MPIDLDSPAFGAIAPTETATTEAPQAESGEPKEQPTSGGEPDVEQQVPYSRFKTQLEKRREAERLAEEMSERYQELVSRRDEPTRSESPRDSSLPSWWVKMYGDNDNSREAYKYELERQDAIRQEARRDAIEAIREERQSETRAIQGNERVIDNRLENLSESLGRNLTEPEESALLDIIDEYTPKDEYGNYAGDLISFEKAWEIMQLRQTTQGQRTRQARSPAVAATGARTQGEPSDKAKNDANFNPKDWNAYRKRL